MGISAALAAGLCDTSAHAQATDIKVRKPDVLLLIDNSGSMTWTLAGTSGVDCKAGKKARYTVLAETLTGTVNNLACSDDVVLESTPSAGDAVGKGCRPYRNLSCDTRKALGMETDGCAGSGGPKASSAFGWPRRNGATIIDRDPLAFCGKGGKYSTCTSDSSWGSAICDEKKGEWDQNADGLIDTYSSSIRFGMASFDMLDTYTGGACQGKPADCYCNKDSDCFAKSGWSGAPLGADSHACDETAHQCLPLLTAKSTSKRGPMAVPVGCQNVLTGGTWSGSTLYGCQDTYDIVWDHYSVKLTGSPQWSYWYHDSLGSVSWLTGDHSSYSGNVLTSFGVASEASVDLGIRNSRAWPTRGRLIGFGPADYDTKSSAVTCKSEDECTQLHNAMVERAIVGMSQYLDSSTPLAGMMRDAYEFIKYDTHTKGVHLPHDMDVDPTASAALYSAIGPKADPYYSGTTQCRQTAVVLVTDGEPTDDIQSRLSEWAGKLYDEENVRTFVVGVGMDSASYWDLSSNSLKTKDCAALTTSDLQTGKMCERQGALSWRFADSADANHTGVTPSAIRACCTLLEAAVEGSDGSGVPYFPKNQSELKSKLSEVLQKVAGGAVSRTVPVFAPVTRSFSGSGSTNAPATSYELRSSMDVEAGATMWRGHLERVRAACSDKDEPVLQDIDVSKGDRFDKNLETGSSDPKRKLFTVMPVWSSGTYSPTVAAGSLRDGVANAYDGLFPDKALGNFVRLGGGKGDFTTTDPLVLVPSLKAAFDKATTAPKLEELLNIGSADSSSCTTQTGATTASSCAERVIRWFGGDIDPDDGGAKSSDPCPSRVAGSAQCKGTNCSTMGAIYRSSPIVVLPPQAGDSDDASYGANQSEGTPSFVERYGNRPTMVYSQTTDGMLHAFVLSKNESDSAKPFGGSEIPSADTLENNELWSFVPPAVLPKLWSNFNINARLLDGQVAAADVVYERSTDTSKSSWDYATVIVGSSGPTNAGGFYYALDVTDPRTPKFLWQLSSAGDSKGVATSPLFGENVPGALITHIRHRDADGKEKYLAVAVLPGGTPSAATPKKVTSRRQDPTSYWSGENRVPRGRIRDWSDLSSTGEVPSRSLTFVELKTGRILARVTGSMADNPRDPSDATNTAKTSLSSYVVAPPRRFDSPISGIPVAYPASIGATAKLVYVGDADGTLWRIDVTNPDPKDWNVEIAFDAYNRGEKGKATLYDAYVPSGPAKGGLLALEPKAEDAALLGHPIENAPLLSLDELQHPVLSFSTGEQDTFSTYSPGTVNVLVSFADVYGGVRAKGYQADVSTKDGVELAFTTGGRVTGPLNLFDGKLFFAYFDPAQNLACTNGTGGICGVDYLHRDEDGSPLAVIDLDGAAGEEACSDFSDGSVVFGISVDQVPSCSGDAESFDDPWASGSYDAITSSKVSHYELSFHTGQGGGLAPNKGISKIRKIALPAPLQRTVARSWVSVLD